LYPGPSRGCVRWLTALLLAQVLGAGCSESPSTAKTAATVAATRVVECSLTAEALAREYQADAGAADARYKGKWLAVDGLVEDIDLLAAGLTSVRIRGLPSDPDRKLSGRSLRCEFVAAALPEVSRIPRGQRLTFQGHCRGDHGGFVDFVECVPVEVGPEPTVAVAAAQLTRDFLADEKAADVRYKDRALLVEGTVVGFKEEGDVRRLLLGGHNEQSPVAVRVLVACAAQDREQLGSLKAGDKVRIRGQCAGLFLGEVLIQDARRVK
jgi:hypothetical protein